MYFRKPIVKRIITAGLFLFALMAMATASQSKVKNVILMIADGRGFNALQATEYYAGQKTIYEGFAIKYGMQTYSAGIRNGEPGSAYSPAAMAKDFRYALKGATDSASAATA